MEKKKLDIEYFLLDTELNAISMENNPQKLEAYMERYPHHRGVITDAMTLLRHLKVNPAMAPQAQIDADHDLLFKEIARRKKQSRSLWITIGSAAACACLILGISLFFNTGPDEVKRTSQMLSLLDEVTINTDEVQIISGSTTTRIENNETITQTEDGNLIVGEEEKVKSADLQTELVQLVVPHGKRTNIKFHDGTMAWLNSGSKLIYPKVFATDKREIYIEGEIYLEVEKSKTKPFIVHAKMFDVEVLGTKFNLSAYSEDAESSVILVEGSVDVKTEAHKQRLAPSQGYFAGAGAARVRKVDTYMYTCWRDGVMIIDGESIHHMFARLARHYNVNIRFDNPSVSAEKYKGKLNLHDSLEEVLKTLSSSLSFTYEKTSGNEIHIHMRE